jgi:hypothetical protein
LLTARNARLNTTSATTSTYPPRSLRTGS